MKVEENKVVQELLSETNEIVEVLTKAKIMFHDWAGDELAVYISLPKGKEEKIRKKAADWLALATHKNLQSLVCDAILEAHSDTMGKIKFHKKEVV